MTRVSGREHRTQRGLGTLCPSRPKDWGIPDVPLCPLEPDPAHRPSPASDVVRRMFVTLCSRSSCVGTPSLWTMTDALTPLQLLREPTACRAGGC